MFVREKHECSLARESLGRGPRETLHCAGHYKVGATADVLGHGAAMVPNSVSRHPCQICPGNWQAQPTRESNENSCRARHEAKECNGLNQKLLKT